MDQRVGIGCGLPVALDDGEAVQIKRVNATGLPVAESWAVRLPGPGSVIWKNSTFPCGSDAENWAVGLGVLGNGSDGVGDRIAGAAQERAVLKPFQPGTESPTGKAGVSERAWYLISARPGAEGLWT